MRRAVGAFAKDEVERANDDGFARAGLAGDDIAAGLKFERQVRHEGEVFDAQRRQHEYRQTGRENLDTNFTNFHAFFSADEQPPSLKLWRPGT